MKIERVLIAMLFLGFAFNLFVNTSERELKNNALAVLDERLGYVETNIYQVNEAMSNTLTDFASMERLLQTDIDLVSSELARHKDETEYMQDQLVFLYNLIEEKPALSKADKPVEKIGVSAVKIVEEEIVIDNDIVLERTYDPETGLHVPNLATTPIKPVVVSCPKANNKLNKFISKINIRRDYKFVVTYDIMSDKITNVRFNNKVPSNLQSAVIKFIDSFTRYGDIKDCQISIKVLEN